MSFAGGQDSFSQFTMDMVRQYMKDEEVRLQHQSSLLHLRQKAVKEKTKAELAWLEHQKKRLRDKGEDDKMPPIRKKQRGLLMKLQQEQVRGRSYTDTWDKHIFLNKNVYCLNMAIIVSSSKTRTCLVKIHQNPTQVFDINACLSQN